MRSVVLLLVCAISLLASDELFDAARRGDAAAVKVALEKGAVIDAKWRYDQTALFIAAFRGHTDVVKLLLERGANADVKDSFYGMTALSAAVDKGNTDIIGMLIDKGAAADTRLLQMTAVNGKPEVLKVLVARGSWNPEALSNALSAAEASNKTEAVEVLKAAGAKPKPVVPVDSSVLATYVGQYKGSAGPVKVEVADGKLVVTAGGKMPMRALDDHTFEPAQYPGMVTVSFRKADGKVTGIDLTQGGKTEFLPREEKAQ